MPRRPKSDPNNRIAMPTVNAKNAHAQVAGQWFAAVRAAPTTVGERPSATSFAPATIAADQNIDEHTTATIAGTRSATAAVGATDAITASPSTMARKVRSGATARRISDC